MRVHRLGGDATPPPPPAVSVVAAREGWSLRGAQNPPAPGALARGKWVAFLCRWWLLEGMVSEGSAEPS